MHKSQISETCPKCGSANVGSGGMAARGGKRRQRLKCLGCKHTFYPKAELEDGRKLKPKAQQIG